MRRINICEERGTGIDKVVFQTELYQLPAPIFEQTEQHTRSCQWPTELSQFWPLKLSPFSGVKLSY